MAAIGDKMCKALNEQVKWELYSSYLYLSMSAYFSSINLPGFAHWMKVQAQEELLHAMMIYDYVVERDGRIELLGIEKPPSEWDSPLQVAEEVYAHEQKVTGMINDLVDLASLEKDHASHSMLQWFVEEQVEEESNAKGIMEKLKMVSDDRSTGVLYMFDRELELRRPKLQEVTSEE